MVKRAARRSTTLLQSVGGAGCFLHLPFFATFFLSGPSNLSCEPCNPFKTPKPHQSISLWGLSLTHCPSASPATHHRLLPEIATGTVTALATGSHDFFSSPALSPDGRRLAWCDMMYRCQCPAVSVSD